MFPKFTTKSILESLGKRLVDVLDDKGANPKYREFWNKMFAKMNTLLVAMESAKGPATIKAKGAIGINSVAGAISQTAT
mgnify:CR=1 FL=1